MERVSFYNRKGGIGKSTLAYNISFGLSKINKKVCLLDLDSQKDSTNFLGTFLNGESKDYVGFDELFDASKKVSIENCLIEVRTNLYVISNRDLRTMETILGKNIRAEKMFEEKINKLKELGFDYVLYDCSPSLISKINDSALCNSDSIVLPVQLQSAAIRASANVANYLAELYIDPSVIKCVIPNMKKSTKESTKNLELVYKIFDVNIVTEAVKDKTRYTEASKYGKSIFEYDKDVAKEFMETFRKVVNLIG
ncbi:ParA family protein [Clostridium sp. WILCCON 0269]|uniref:ParA family protein n=1 Tax=Candidatus Clostridium eludens TaxID=3381663 RepID=A0ABW8SRV1_9CLOT